GGVGGAGGPRSRGGGVGPRGAPPLPRAAAGGGAARRAFPPPPPGLGGDVGGDLRPEPIREPLRVGDVAVIAAAVWRGKLEQAAERAGRVRVGVGEREAGALPSLLRVPRGPVVLACVPDLWQRPRCLPDGPRMRAEL